MTSPSTATSNVEPSAVSLRPEAASPAICVRGLNHFFGDGELRKQILFDIDFEIASGEVVILTGPSGCGKTTLLSLIGGLRAIMQGSVRVLGRELFGATQEDIIASRRQTGFVFQLHNLLDFMTAQQNVQMSVQLDPAIDARDRAKRAVAMLGKVGLSDRLNYFPAALSGGQRQRVSIARALAGEPRLILADEPTAALDSLSGRQAVELVQQMAREQGCTVLMVTHDTRILDIADRVVRMEDGRMLDD
jgi:putative ABC transport system ATP-binding protein